LIVLDNTNLLEYTHAGFSPHCVYSEFNTANRWGLTILLVGSIPTPGFIYKGPIPVPDYSTMVFAIKKVCMIFFSLLLRNSHMS